ncbi:uncharacterized protein [Trachinotus anak]|uniref:uncharacterized protein n=1 Tax=Trachinotus anak TaxID=443729 RepID=UPI0039F22C4F
MPLHYIMFGKPTIKSIKPVFHLLKKHIVPGHYSLDQFRHFKESKGIHLAYPQGWQLSMCLVPDRDLPPHTYPAGLDKDTLTYFSTLKDAICQSLKGLPEQDLLRPTIRKNKLYDLSRFNILPQDQEFMLNLIDSAVIHTHPPRGLKPLVFACKFGQKQTSSLILGDLFDMSNIQCVSIHSACDVRSKERNVHHFWSKYALHDLVGRLGAMYNALSLREAVNYQSNLDGKLMSIDENLLGIARFPADVTFIQLYADTPHNRLDDWRAHPITGEIVCCGLLHHETTRAMSRRSAAYLSHMQDLLFKLRRVLSARVEIVTSLQPQQIGDGICAVDLFHVNILKGLIASRPMLIPFVERQPGCSFTGMVTNVAAHLIDTLAAQLASGKGQGKFMEAWTAYQAEMALEVYFWGHPLSSQDNIYAINLGVATHNERSVTWQRGFLALVPANSAASENEPPPLHHWTSKVLQTTRIHRLFGFADLLDSSYTVLGLELLKIIVRDLYKSNRAHLRMLAANTPPSGTCINIVSRDYLVSLLMQTSRFKYPATCQRAAAILAEKGLPLKDVMEAGLQASGIKYFPAFKTTDTTQQPKFSWNFKSFWNVVGTQQDPPFAAKVAVISGEVTTSLVHRGLTYERNLADVKENGMPWMHHVMQRLMGVKNLSREQLVLVCTFVSCVALIQQGIFVDYRALSRLEIDLPLSQARLRMLQIQSPIYFAGVRVFNLYRLHPDIPFKIKQSQPRPVPSHHQNERQSTRQNLPSDNEEEEELGDFQGEEHNQVLQTQSMVLPAGWRRYWSPHELSVVAEAGIKAGNSTTAAYKVYQGLCLEHRIPVRSFHAFKKKQQFMRKADKQPSV